MLFEENSTLYALEEGKYTSLGTGLMKLAKSKDKSGSRVVFSNYGGNILLNSKLYISLTKI